MSALWGINGMQYNEPEYVQGVGDRRTRQHPSILGADVRETQARLGRAVADVLCLVGDGAVEAAPRKDAATVCQRL